MNRAKIEFIGFLFGEGCFFINRLKHNKWHTTVQYAPSIVISLREDDIGILKWAHKTYGGTLIRIPGRWQIPNQNAIYRWDLHTAKRVLECCNDVLTSVLPSRKLEQAKLLRDVCALKVKRFKEGHKGMSQRWYTDKEIAYFEWAWLELKRMKKYRPQKIVTK